MVFNVGWVLKPEAGLFFASLLTAQAVQARPSKCSPSFLSQSRTRSTCGLSHLRYCLCLVSKVRSSGALLFTVPVMAVANCLAIAWATWPSQATDVMFSKTPRSELRFDWRPDMTYVMYKPRCQTIQCGVSARGGRGGRR